MEKNLKEAMVEKCETFRVMILEEEMLKEELWPKVHACNSISELEQLLDRLKGIQTRIDRYTAKRATLLPFTKA